MIYNTFKDKKVSSLGLGCMRLPVIDGDDSRVNIPAAKEMVAYAMKKGINYFDTAWVYHGGNSESIMGEILGEYDRESYYLATKFPGFDLSNIEKVEEIFEQQIKNCKTDYFDFYLFHNVCEKNIDLYLDPKYRIFDYLMEQKKNGRIKHLGFSTHGNLETMTRFLEAYGSDMEFCQLQINWLDWEFQNAKEKVELVSRYNIPVWVMEPVRGGSLINLKPQFAEKLKALRPDFTAAEWAFRFIQSIPEVKVTLSGMSNLEQLKQNIATFESKKPLTEQEINTLLKIGRIMTSKDALPCTACRYCTAHCPQEINIPWMLELYNEHKYSGGGFIAPMALESVEENHLPSACIGCRACEAVCPQNIKISEALSDFAKALKE